MDAEDRRSGAISGRLGAALPPVWLRYRDAFAVLQYMSTVAGGRVGKSIPWAKVVAALGFSPEQGEALLGYLMDARCVVYRQGRREAGLTPAALAYLSGERGRRCSVRPAHQSH